MMKNTKLRFNLKYELRSTILRKPCFSFIKSYKTSSVLFDQYITQAVTNFHRMNDEQYLSTKRTITSLRSYIKYVIITHSRLLLEVH